MPRRLPAILLVVAVVAVLALVAWPEAAQLQRGPLAAQAVAFRGGTVAAAGGLAVLLTAVGLVLHRLRSLLGALAIVLIVYSAGVGALLILRGVGAPDLPTPGRYDLTVVGWNTLGDSVPAESIADVAAEQRADVVALPETTAGRADAVAALLAKRGRRFRVLAVSEQAGIPARSTSLLISTALGPYTRVRDVGDTAGVPSVVADPSGGQNGPRIVAVHTTAPYRPDPAGWRGDLDWVADRCSGRNVVLAGDFNATLDHFAGLGRTGGQLAACRDGALSTRNAAVGTWPTMAPALIGAPIDHVLATPNWRFTGFRVLTDDDSAGSDHRPIVARLTPAG